MIKNFEFYFPTKIKYGEGVLNELGNIVKEFKKSRPFIVTDPGVIAAGLADMVIKQLEKAGITEYEIFDAVAPNPRTDDVNAGGKAAKAFGADILIAVGGGSPIDTAKGIGVLMTNDGVIEDYEGYFKLKNDIPPFITIPTTVGTGSEVTEWAVITDMKRKFKMSVADYKLYPDIALCDPAMVKDLPARIVASTGMDALSHCIESYVCNIATPTSDAIALYGMEVLSQNIRRAVYANDYEAKANMQLGALFGGIALSQADIAGVHCMGEALGGMYDTPHGIANASVLPYVMDFSCIADVDKYARIATALGADISNMDPVEAAHFSARIVKRLNDDMKIPNLEEAGINPDDFQALAEKSEANISNPSNPRPATADDYYKLFEQAYKGEL